MVRDDNVCKYIAQRAAPLSRAEIVAINPERAITTLHRLVVTPGSWTADVVSKDQVAARLAALNDSLPADLRPKAREIVHELKA